MKTPYQLLVRNLYADDDLYDPLWSTLENVELDTEVDYDRDGPQGSYPIIKDFDREVGSFYEHLRRANIESVQDLVLVDVNRKTVVSHRDIGIGVSQVLPVLVSAFAAEQETVAIEQPEIHLHPGLQAELGDVFVNAALGAVKNHFIIETHSEHLILRLLRRIRETSAGKNETTAPIKPEDVMLLYVQVADAESRFIELRVDQRGRLIDPCPDGFFEEDFAELF
jgi:predicted ATPase